ncbi:MAG: hypothetical protein ABSC53_12775 [Bacteroidota bacterium]
MDSQKETIHINSKACKSSDLIIEKKVGQLFNEFEKISISERKVLIHQVIDQRVIDEE